MRKSNLLKVFPMFVWIYQNMHFFWSCYICHTHPLLKLFLHTQWEAARCSCRARVSSSKTPGCVEWMMSAVEHVEKMQDDMEKGVFRWIMIQL
jgi:hypothetical protein